DLLCAIEQTQEEFDEDAEVRFLALKVLAAFRASNAVQAIAQMALYDLSSKLRANAVTFLAEINHESVFEPIVNACADPTREVRAAAARGLFRLGFDRADAWARIVESGNEGRMRQAARSAIEGDLVERSFDRLVHKDKKNAYEAFALTSLLIKAGETEPIYRALAKHKDESVKLALLHVLQTIKNEDTFESLSDLMTRHNLTPNVAAKVNEVRSYSQLMSV
ncbi:MAG: HEAT repeat domain-containing protein, partial [Pyrinomonadaceae bacterium]